MRRDSSLTALGTRTVSTPSSSEAVTPSASTASGNKDLVAESTHAAGPAAQDADSLPVFTLCQGDEPVTQQRGHLVQAFEEAAELRAQALNLGKRIPPGHLGALIANRQGHLHLSSSRARSHGQHEPMALQRYPVIT
jgi:hypothetical protein